ncbi:MAG: Trm112 family protein [Aquabacterium sp.]|jgi:uncharacterized protein|uniref:Trm112 family protein n=1 Tax=Aquabacterium sp. TaxID=1872578 RepID=UPI003BB14359
MDTRLIELLVCPVCKGPLQRGDDGQALVCPADRLAFPIRDGIPVMLENEAVSLDQGAPSPAPAGTPSALPGQPG